MYNWVGFNEPLRLLLQRKGRNMKKVELLAPAGSFESFIGAIHAGADAVYLGGEKFGARAYAQNFTTEELCEALDYAHLNGRKVYLTINTMLKQSEMQDLYDYLLPFYERGLDGVIVQDMGVFQHISKYFPGLELHVSTQAGLTGEYGARFFKTLGASRIVPARELSLEEIKEIKRNVPIEIETFIHGAMCYCYSGQCLFSSILGGRSGNRGKCAGPCRLPYNMQDGNKKENYPLSLKDMCTIEMLPQLIEAGIDSFKIEGRMKRPEYAAGVTALYRKYIDLYYAKGAKQFKVESKDLEMLKHLYLRSQLHNGYYEKHNGKEMITIDSPGYNETDERLCERIRKEYLTEKKKFPISMHLQANVGEEMRLSAWLGEHQVYVTGGMVMQAQNKPMDYDAIYDKMKKLGDTPFILEDFALDSDDNIFVPVKELNEIRRNATEQLLNLLLPLREGPMPKEEFNDVGPVGCKTEPGFHVSVSTWEQLEGVNLYLGEIQRLYVEATLIGHNSIERDINRISEYTKQTDGKTILALPHMVRKKDIPYLRKILQYCLENGICDALVRNYETIGLLENEFSGISYYLDQNLSSWNKESYKFWQKKTAGMTYSFELNRKEKRRLGIPAEQILYGNIPMMVSANCYNKTSGKCKKGKIDGENRGVYRDRYQKEFPVSIFCDYCYNIIWNSVPLSLHNYKDQYADGAVRISFTTETKEQTKKILEYYLDKTDEIPLKDFTAGHEKRGVE